MLFRSRTSQDNIVDPVIFQIAQSGGIALPACEEMLIDAQDGRTARRVDFGEMAFQSMPEMAFDSSGADGFAPSHTATVDTVEMLAKDGLAKRFGGMLARQNAGQ